MTEQEFSWCSRVLAEIQTAAREIAAAGLFKTAYKRRLVAEIDENAQAIREFLAEKPAKR